MSQTYTLMKAGVKNLNKATFTKEGLYDAVNKYWDRDSSRAIVRKSNRGDDVVVTFVSKTQIAYDEGSQELRLTLPDDIVNSNKGSYIVPILNVEKEVPDRTDGVIADVFTIGAFLLTVETPAFQGINNQIK